MLLTDRGDFLIDVHEVSLVEKEVLAVILILVWQQLDPITSHFTDLSHDFCVLTTSDEAIVLARLQVDGHDPHFLIVAGFY